jgi:hypothetical protein
VSAERYIREKLAEAVNALAVSAAPIQVRVGYAARALTVLQPEDFVDAESRLAFTAVRDMATSREAVADEGTIAATTSAMSDEQAEALARQIMELDHHYRPMWYFVGRSILDPSPPPQT